MKTINLVRDIAASNMPEKSVFALISILTKMPSKQTAEKNMDWHSRAKDLIG